MPGRFVRPGLCRGTCCPTEGVGEECEGCWEEEEEEVEEERTFLGLR